ncbi:hypothetical protein STSV2_02 [Sulfolobus virus STSV2]|uniref:hypothetical protein n=1 Tax=Sulfolobus virus STSV2 TaxID=1123964 RepID=UPI0002A7C049|nr:hypothetical protein STSV2_02 [Sulfolobus virus STSV2]AFU91981.1 hypothetical protein STSV2_02 [Sulfolobus virus STSV2]
MAAQPLTQIPASNAGVKVDEFFDEKELIKIASRLGPVQKKVLKALAQSGGKMMMQHDFRTWGQKTIAGIVGGVNAEYRALNTRKLCEALERKGLVTITIEKCPNHPKYNKKFVYLTPKGYKIVEIISQNE